MATTLTKPPKAANSSLKSRRERAKFPDALGSLLEYCAGLQPGDMVPTHSELMRRFDTSERAVLKALEELQRSGKIVRKRGIGTFVTERNSVTELTQPVMPSVVTDHQTVVAILRPDHSFFDRCLEVVFRQAKGFELNVACRLVEENSEWAPEKMTETNQTAGFIVFSWHLLRVALQLQAAGQRVVCVGARPLDDMPEVPWVLGDQEQGGYMIVRHLLELGHKKIAFVGFTRLDDGMRGAGNSRAVKEWNATLKAQAARDGSTAILDLIEVSFISSEDAAAWEGNPAMVKAYFDKPDAATAIVAFNDHQALGLLGALNRAGLNVPGDVSLVGYDALPEGSMIHPSITTINPQTEQQIQSALKVLTRPTAPPSSHSTVVVPSFVLGESTGPPRPTSA